MKESSPLNSIITISSNNNISEPLLNDSYNNNKITNQNNILLKVSKKPLVPTNVVHFSFKRKPLQRIEDKVISFSKRRKFPKKICNLLGYLMSLSLFLLFTILLTISLSFSKDILIITESIKKSYNYILFLYG